MFRAGLLSGLMLISTALGGVAAAGAQPQEHRYMMTRHVREEARAMAPVGRLPAATVLHFDVLMPLSAPAELDRFLAAAYNPKSSSYRQFLSPAQFTARFGPSQADWDELVSFAKQNGFTIVGGSRDEMDLRLAGSVSAVEAAFHIKMNVYRHPNEPRTFYSPDTEPSVDLQAEIWHVSGLDNFSTPSARVQARSSHKVTAMTSTGACPGNSYCGSDMRAAYYGGSALTGTGQSIGLVEFYGYDSADLNTYFSNAGQTNKVPVNGISTDGTSLTCLYSKACDDTEQTLDMTQALGMAPGLAQLNVYVGSSDTAILSAMSVPPPGSVTGKVDAQLSCSWGWGPADPATDDPLFKKFAAQGQSFFTAAGDSSAYSSKSQAVFPADDANVTVVGGTDLATAGANGVWLYESAWSDGGGGYFTPDNISIPSWQIAAVAEFNAQSSKTASTTLRNSPDVSAEANFDFYVCADQKTCTENEYGGTSFAAPMWAGYMALVNQQALINGGSTVGFINPAIYALGEASAAGYGNAFHDVTAGSNGYAAVTGYDLATGWGSPNGAGLIAALAGPSAPGFSLTTNGPLSVAEGGSGKVTLTSAVAGGYNAGIALSASGQPTGVTVSFSPASLTGAGSSTITFQVAPNVAAGVYPITVSGTTTATGASAPKAPSTAVVSLTVTVPNFSLAENGSMSVAVGNSGSVTISSTATGGFNSAIALTATGLPNGVTATFSPTTITSTGTSTLSLQAAPTTAAGTYLVTISGTNGTLVRTATMSLIVTVPSFSLASSAGSLSVTEGLSGGVTLTSSASGGFSAPITLTATGQPSGVGVSFSPASITGAGSTTVKFAVAANAAVGAYPILLTGTSGSLRQNTTVILNVGAAGFTITGGASTLSAMPGTGAGMSLTTAVTGVLGAPIALSVGGLPAGVTATLSANSTTPPSTVTLNLSTTTKAAPGSYPITISGVSGGVTGKFIVTLVVNAATPPSFAFSVGTTALAVTHGTSSTLTVQTTLSNTTAAGSAAPLVALAVSGLPAGVTASFSPATLTGAATSTVTLTAASTAKAGPVTLTFSATAGSYTQTSSLNLTVN